MHAVLVEVPVVGFAFLSECYSSFFAFVCWIQVLFQDDIISLQGLDHPLPPRGDLLVKGEFCKGQLSHRFLICICMLFLVKDRRENLSNSSLFVFHSQL